MRGRWKYSEGEVERGEREVELEVRGGGRGVRGEREMEVEVREEEGE